VNKPIVDDDPQVPAAVRRISLLAFRETYTTISATSGVGALKAIRQLKSRGDSLAIIISDLPEYMALT
jgi:thioredoxin reductase (NADPH)